MTYNGTLLIRSSTGQEILAELTRQRIDLEVDLTWPSIGKEKHNGVTKRKGIASSEKSMTKKKDEKSTFHLNNSFYLKVDTLSTHGLSLSLKD